jgi:hypothetical protein
MPSKKKKQLNFQIKIRNEVWTVKTGKPSLKRSVGVCDYEKREIVFKRDAIERYGVELVAHEIAHACLPDIQEETIDALGKTISTAVCKVVEQMESSLCAPDFSNQM